MGIFKGHNVTHRADKIASFQVATAEYGATVPEVLGTTRLAGNVIFYDDFTAHEHRETQKAGKGGRSKVTTITYTYTVAVILGLCEGPVNNILRVWRNKELLNYPDDAIELTLFRGTADQQPWPYLVGKHPDKALPYKGLAYMAGILDLGDSGSMPNFNFEVKGKLTETGDGVDVNPADYVLYILEKIGLQDIPVEGLDNYRTYCREANLLISTPAGEADAEPARETVNTIAELTNAYIYWSNDRFKIVPRADRPVGTWSPNRSILYDLTPDDFIMQGGACVTYTRKDSSEVFNRFTIEFLNRENGYEKETVSYEDTEDIALHGVRQSKNIKAHYIYSKKRAVMIAEEVARRNKYERNKYTFKLDWAFCRLEPGDLVTLTDKSIGLDHQAVMIDSVKEGADGLLTFTAISRAGKDFLPAQYDVHDIDRPFIDFNQPVGNVADPIIFQPPTELTQLGNELWLGTKGTTDNWGGCTVYISDSNEHYAKAGEILVAARMGTLASTMTAGSTTVDVNINGQLLSGTAQDAERGNTLLWVDGECMSYQTAELLPNGAYRLTGLVRGQYNTSASIHGEGSRIIRCDEALLRLNVRKEDIGKHIWLKFASRNVFGSGQQDMADLPAYEYNLAAYQLPSATGLNAYTRYYQTEDAVSYSVQVEWVPPVLSTYARSQVWYRVNGQGQWIYADSGINSATIPNAVVGDSYTIAVCTEDVHGVYLTPDSAPNITITIMTRSNTPNAPENVSIDFGRVATVSWNFVNNADVRYYEVRTDTNTGNTSFGYLGRTQSNSMIVQLANRQGIVYVYAYGANKVYSLPGSIGYNLPVPAQPAPPTLMASMVGFRVDTPSIPRGCYGMKIYLDDGTELTSTSKSYTHNCEPGIYHVSVAYVDCISEGPSSGEAMVTVKLEVSGDMVHITENTVFDNSVIVNRMLQANCVTADKTAINSLDAITATIGLLRTATSGARMELADNNIRIYDENNRLRVRMGVWGGVGRTTNI